MRLPLLMTLALILSACGGGTATDEDFQDEAGSVQEDQSDATEAAVPATEAANALSEVTAKRRQATYKVSYQWTSGNNPPANETWYQKPPRSRIDFGSATDQQWTAQFVLENGLFFCQTTDRKVDCWKAPHGDAKLAEDLSFATAIISGYEDLLSDATFAAQGDDRTIAGQRASCATARNVVILGFAEITVCHAGNGVPLLLEWKVGDETLRMEATSYTTAVPDSALELLATPQESDE